MKANYEDKIQKQETQVEMGNLYDMNKQLMLSQPKITEDKLSEVMLQLYNWITKYTNQHYFMMLCHERRDFTLFNIQPNGAYGVTIGQINTMVSDIIECMTNRGALLAVELQEDDAWELWLRVDDECFVYYLFPYGEAVLEY